ncbi:MAG: hypothetical protein GSR79_09810 [Desulfurococcales archaeon]|nr:hypothetical protein [Desulfurococcales archaeon]
MIGDPHKLYQSCNEESDAYHLLCSKLQRLCPRLVPSPLWGLSIANIARMAPQAALAVCDSCPEIIEKIHRYWITLDRGGECEVCNKPGSEIDEDWLYCIFDENGNLVSGVAAKTSC